MLVLSRKEQQKIRIGDKIVVTIVKISGNKIKLGITAPVDINVRRIDGADDQASVNDGADKYEI